MGTKGKLSRTEEEKQRDYLEIAPLMIMNTPIRAIVEILKENEERSYTLSQTQVHRDTKAILQQWQEERKDFIDLLMDKELAKLDLIEREAWGAWQESKKGEKTTKIEGGEVINGQVSSGKIKERTMKSTPGDPRYLDMVQKCIDKRVEILGFAAAKKIDVNATVGVGNAIVYMAKDELDKEISRLYSTPLQSLLEIEGEVLENAPNGKKSENN